MALTQFVFGAMESGHRAMFVAGSTVEAETPSGSNAATTAAATAAQNVCRVVSDTAVYVSFGSAPNAGTDAIRFYLPAGEIEYFRVSAGDKGAVIAA